MDQYARQGIQVEGNQPAIYELCRYLASLYRDSVLATPAERRANLPRDLEELCVLEDWHHPDIIASELPGQTQIARAAVNQSSRFLPIKYANARS